MYKYTSNNWSHRNGNKTFKRKICKPQQESIQQIHYKTQLYL